MFWIVFPEEATFPPCSDFSPVGILRDLESLSFLASMVLEHEPRVDLVAMYLVMWVEKVRRVLRDSFLWDHAFFLFLSSSSSSFFV